MVSLGGAYLQFKLTQRGTLRGFDIDVLLVESLEASGFDLDCVTPGEQIGDNESAIALRFQDVLVPGIFFNQGNARARHNPAARVRHGAGDRGCGLGHRPCRPYGQTQSCKQKAN